MKMNNIYLLLLTTILVSVLSCQKVNIVKSEGNNEGLLNFFVSIPGESAEYSGTVAGPYQDGDTIYIKVPTSEDNPLDVTQLEVYASIANNSRMVPPLTGITDFTGPLEVTVIDGQGVKRTNYVKVIPTLPKTVFKKLWFKNAQTLGISRTNISGMTVLDDNLMVADFNVWDASDPTSGVRIYDRTSGEFKKIVPAPTTFTMKVCADDAGHFVINRYNIYGAGFMLYYYDDINSTPQLILNYTAADGCPVNLGDRMSVTGNLKEGKAYVYATTAGANILYYWEFIDGVPQSTIPNQMKLGAAGGDWSFASVQRQSVEDTSDLYVSYCDYDAADAAALAKGSRFDIVGKNMNVVQMNKENHDYKIMDFKVFTIHGDVFLAILQQGFWAWDATSLKVFEITNKEDLALRPGAPEYKDFLLMSSDIYGGTNYNKWGDVSVEVSGNEAVIYATMATNDASNAGVMAYKMTYNPQ
jgi:hypothetical protein